MQSGILLVHPTLSGPNKSMSGHRLCWLDNGYSNDRTNGVIQTFMSQAMCTIREYCSTSKLLWGAVRQVAETRVARREEDHYEVLMGA